MGGCPPGRTSTSCPDLPNADPRSCPTRGYALEVPTCAHCGEEIAPSAKFCPECGTAQQSASTRPQEARKTVTVVFSDLVDSTPLGEELDAESLRMVMDAYFAAMRTELERHGGVVEKFIGDAVMAVFGLPRMHEDDALRAVRAAVGMREALAILNLDLAATCGVTLRNRTGVNTGMVVVGDGSGGQRLATGDAVNVAARLEHAAPAGGIVLGSETFRLVKPFVKVSAIGSLNLKGKSTPVDAWQLMTLDSEHGSSRSPSARPLVGRLAELATIDARLTAAADNHRVEAVLLVGEPGVGKSRLTREAVDRLATAATVLNASCRPYGRPSFWPVTELLGSASARDQPLDFDGLRAMAGAAQPEDRDAIVERVASLLGLTDAAFPLVECFWATARLFATLAAGRPLVLVVEDLHWAEATMLELLDHLRLSPYPGGMLIMATARPEVLNLTRPSAVLPVMDVIRLKALTPAESDDLIVDVLGSSSLPASAQALIRGAAAGNPLFLEQALATWIEEGVLAPVVGGWTVTRPVTEVRVPASLSAIFASRLDRLADEERSVLGAASVAGPTFDRRALPPMLDDVDVETVDDCLQRLVRSGLLVPGRSDGPTELIEFGHASLRDVAYELTLKRDRAAFHERFALWHENRTDTGHLDGLIGHHLAEAFKYHAELRHVDVHATGLAFASVQHLVSDSQRALRIGDRAGAERLTDRIVEVLSAIAAVADAANLTLMEKTAKLLVTMGRWRNAVTLLSPYATFEHGPLLRDLGVALCKLYRANPQSPDYREGQRLLELAGAPPNRDTDALASLAGTWKGIDDARAHAFYRECLDLDPTDPYALGNVLEYEIAAAGDLSVVARMWAQISDANRRCRSQADEGANLPWAFFDAGKFALLLGRPYDAIAAYCKAVQLTTAEHMLMTSMSSLERLVASGGAIPGSTWVQALLAVARSVQFPSAESLAGLGAVAPLPNVRERTRVVMLAGGTDEAADGWLDQYAKRLVDGFLEFEGLVVSGGTSDGVSGLAGSLSECFGERVTAYGYLPTHIPDGAPVDERYDALRRTSGSGFSIAEGLQAWADLIASGVRPVKVKLLAVSGGTIAEAEYRVALALGCMVGVVSGSGRAADRLLEDPDWVAAPNLTRLDADAESIRRFLSAEA